jgi:hypothetical protein
MNNEAPTYQIPVCNLSMLEEQIAKLNRRAVKLGCEPATLTTIRSYEMDATNPNTGMVYKRPMLEVAVSGEPPKFEGWSLLAVIERCGDENLVRTVPGQTVPVSYRTTDYHCDHCATERLRKEVFVLQHEDGRTVQVGRQCIADFLGHVSAAQLANRAEWRIQLAEATEKAESDYYGGRSPILRPIKSFLGTVAICIRRLGWLSATARNENGINSSTTAEFAWMLETCHDNFTKKLVETNDLHPEDRDTALVEEALTWARELKGENNYEYNLGVACRQEMVSGKTTGLVASAIAAYCRYKERQDELIRVLKQRPVSQHVGEISKRQVFSGCTILGLHYFESQFGTRTLVRFDCDGNILIWWASKEVSWEIGDVLDIKGTVTKHGDYTGTQQTELKRVVAVNPVTRRSDAVLCD